MIPSTDLVPVVKFPLKRLRNKFFFFFLSAMVEMTGTVVSMEGRLSTFGRLMPLQFGRVLANFIFGLSGLTTF
jgi:hypothetical protein